ncbi:hypothetical protein LWI29_013309 [Acer saccharum]|uniref:Uncharacterized protein n=1 Tax=Acer saccharum TaxID=4024 RepID=A0AA39ST52_ACESA|nr:hypothetical protein LWI29_013309 [Acer saccharum]
MALCMSLVSVPSLYKFGLSPQFGVSCGKRGALVSRSLAGFLSIRAVQENGGPRRLVDIIRIVPELSRNYFRSPSRRTLFGGISLLGGFYVAQTISLSFGALGVNDVIAAVLCVLLTEYVTRFYYSRPKLVVSCIDTAGAILQGSNLCSFVGIHKPVVSELT